MSKKNIFISLILISSISFIIFSSSSEAQVCQVNITWSSNSTYTIDQNNTYYCLNQSWYLTVTAIQFANPTQNSTIDCLNYNLDSNNTINTYGVYMTGSSTKNNTVKNCNITDFYHGIYLYNGPNNNTIINSISNSNSRYGILLSSSSNNTIYNNTVKNNLEGFAVYSNSNFNIFFNNTANNNANGFDIDTSNNNTIYNNTVNSNTQHGIWLWDSDNNTIYNNTVNNNTEYGFYLAQYSSYNILYNNVANYNKDGFLVWGSSTYNTFSNNIANYNNYGFYFSSNGNYNTLVNNTINGNTIAGIIFSSSYNNNITGGSISHNTNYDYYLTSAGTTNNFTNTNFTDSRKIYFADATSWFNYRNETNGIWLKTNVSATATLTRKLISWSKSIMKWNDSASTAVTARYNISESFANKQYKIYNDTQLVDTLTTNANGELNFTIYLSSEHTITVQYGSCDIGISSLPYTIDKNNTYYCVAKDLFIGGQDAITFTSGIQNSTLDCLSYNIKGSDTSGAYGIVVSGKNNTVKNCVVTDFYSGIKLSASNYNILVNNVVNYNIYYGIYLSSSSNNNLTNIIANYNRLGCGIYILSSNNNQITNITANYNMYGFYLSSSHNNTITNSKAQKNTDYGIRIVSSGSTPNKIYNNLFNNTNNFNFAGTVYNNSWNTTRQTGTRIYSEGTEIGGNYWTNSTGNGYSDTCVDSDKDGFCDSPYILNYTATTNNTDYLPLSPDKTPPNYSLNSTNSTLAGTPVEHRLKWGDNTDLSGYIFSFWNCANISYDWTSTNQESSVKQFRATTEEIEGFEGSFLPSGWQTGGYQDRIWFRSTKNPYAGIASAESGNLYDWGTQRTWLNKTFTYYSDGNISFYWTVSSEANYDWLCYCIDKACGDTGCTCVGSSGTADERISGSVAWTQVIKPVTEETHTFTWCYAKDSSVTSGEDMGRIDEVKFNWTAKGWKEQNRTWQEYTSIGGNAYINITSVKAIITINSYDPSGSNTTYDNNIRPDIEVGIWNGSQYIVENYCNLNNTQGNNVLNTTPVNCTLTKVDSDILTAWKTPSNRKIKIRGIWMDINGSYKDEINISAVYANVIGTVEFLNDTWTEMTGTGNWSNVTKTINSTIGCTIRWCVYANDTSNNWNGTSCQNPFSYVTTLTLAPEIINCNITGYSLYYNNGSLTKDATITSIVKETGDRRYNDFSNGYFNLGCYSPINHSTNKFTMGIIINSSDEKISYNQLIIGFGGFVTQTQKCSTKRWQFQGQAIDSSSSSYIAQGNITVGIDDVSETNTTWFSNGIWDIYYSPCLISGEIYTFKFIITSGDKRSYMFLNQVAK